MGEINGSKVSVFELLLYRLRFASFVPAYFAQIFLVDRVAKLAQRFHNNVEVGILSVVVLLSP